MTGSDSPFSFQTINDCCYLLNITPCGGLGLIDAVDIGGYHSLQVILSQAAGDGVDTYKDLSPFSFYSCCSLLR